MLCPKCGKKMGVSNTAGADSNRVYLLDRIAPFIDWYCNEFVARDRRCYECRQAILTVELDIEDLIGALRYAQIDGPMLTQSIIDWSIHIRENARTFKEGFEPTRPDQNQASRESGSLVGTDLADTGERQGTDQKDQEVDR